MYNDINKNLKSVCFLEQPILTNIGAHATWVPNYNLTMVVLLIKSALVQKFFFQGS